LSLTSDNNGDITISGLGAGSYSDVEAVLSGCSSVLAGPYTLSDPNAPTFTVGNPVNPTGCGVADASITISGLDPSTTYNLTYDLNNGTVVGPNSILSDPSGVYVMSGLQGGSYTSFEIELNGCSTVDNANLFLVPFYPTAPIVFTDSVYCEGIPIADLNGIGAFGGDMNWYDTEPIFPVNTVTPVQTVGSPSTFASGVTAPGTYTYWVTETLNGCEGDTSSITITINPQPLAPVGGSDVSYCETQTIADLSANPQGAGTIEWYADSTR